MKATININVADMRSEPVFRSERISQALFNEEVEILEEREQYCRVRARDNYVGWVARQFLSEYTGPDGDGPCVISSALAPAFEEANPGSRRLTSIPYGCRLYGVASEEFLKIRSDRYGAFFIHVSDLCRPTPGTQNLQMEAGNLISEAEKFLGAPYLWGGRSFFGFDCSGFSQIIMNRFGVDLPRDSVGQIKIGVEVNRGDIGAGDLLFFPRHVALAVSGELMIHSSLFNGGVAYNSLDPRSAVYRAYLAKSFVTARRAFP